MRLSDFLFLNNERKKFTVLHEGVLIAKRKSDDCLVLLFQLDHYYVEAFCNQKDKEIDEFRVFQNTQALHPYLEAISIEGIMV